MRSPDAGRTNDVRSGLRTPPGTPGSKARDGPPFVAERRDPARWERLRARLCSRTVRGSAAASAADRNQRTVVLFCGDACVALQAWPRSSWVRLASPDISSPYGQVPEQARLALPKVCAPGSPRPCSRRTHGRGDPDAPFAGRLPPGTFPFGAHRTSPRRLLCPSRSSGVALRHVGK